VAVLPAKNIVIIVTRVSEYEKWSGFQKDVKELGSAQALTDAVICL
jgi:hypothetical protein